MAEVLYKGIEWRRRLLVTEADGVTRTNLDGKVLKLEVRRRTGEPVLIELTSGAGIVHLDQTVDATEGLADVVIAVGLSVDLAAPSLHVINVQLDGQVIMEPQHLEVVAL